ncbi:plasma-membrane proton-efflux P-type ATPase [Cryobacterium sp. PAMC25264]|uniref:plasma-membrane proton-efflux P-type ATPase n=1 Tax=Cryobacterium sp. PAMC25264 TaxID=2861288 RepID=UPI001C632A1F|nr:plasma-membrane proton-efflux P-type ATPase [Cryobacterium sp. PAMC25264]QYF72950.1 plasma-membrane proton-efflux P-type ATPase [Cryobacterium sp. PAMC25264]
MRPSTTAQPAGSGGADKLRSLPLKKVQAILRSGPDGIGQAEADTRLNHYGPNEIEEKTTNQFLKLLGYLWGPIPWMIEAAVILSAVLGHWPDFAIILVLLLANAAVGFTEERQAGNAVAALKAQLAITATVRRDGTWASHPSRDLVPGDVIRLRLGDVVPADARLLPGGPAEVDQSALTGESLPATLNPGDAAYSGSIVRRGEVDALVYATGSATFFGATAHLVQENASTSHFQRAVLRIGNFLIVLAAALVSIIVVVATIRGDPFLTTVEFALVLLVAAIPVAMPTVLSVTMAVGARLLAKKQAIVTRLSAIEELAGVDILCTDKTGTLTMNELTLGDPFTVEGVTAADVVLSAALASRAEDQDTIDLAVLGAVSDDQRLADYRISDFHPFDPVGKRTEAAVMAPTGATYSVTKGAPQIVLELCANGESVTTEVDAAVRQFAERGFRALGVARTDAAGKWHFQGVLPLFDPPRDDAKHMISTAVDMGVAVKMVTGDQLAIAQETAEKLGMGRNILDAGGLGDSTHQETSEATASIEAADGFAQVFPEHKFHIVDILQTSGHIVGMTGDGVNDAPALKKADCGIAVSGATDAARAAADIVLTTPGLSVIIDAITESRRIFERMTSYAIYRIAETLRVLLFMTAAILIFNFYPLTPIMIVILALLNDAAILSIAYDRVHFEKTPQVWDMRRVLGIATVLGVVGPIAAFGLFYLGQNVFGLGRPELQTMMYLLLSVAGHLTIFLTRTRGPFWSEKPARVLVIAVVGTQALATSLALFGIFMTALSWQWVLFVWGYALVWALINDRIKLVAYSVIDRTHQRRGRSGPNRPSLSTAPPTDS